MVSDTEGVNDNLTEAAISIADTAAGSAVDDIRCGISGGNAAAVGNNIATSGGITFDGRFDAAGGTNADCEM